ncbi:hypothetical protein CYMTET_6799 [Cymbomonas tetramitiformis]|uniref:Uncharacterized protein n=1 Tax=Cymbomonas tetramitiformis TaxID=36881 RepID=A0AAE0GY88_9CHLO|nr:hypothetical protein CYMTET_6799 [Cymbomonas tetramitiformis]
MSLVPPMKLKNCFDEAPTHKKIYEYLSKHNLERVVEDMVAFVIFHKPDKPWAFLADYYERILPKVRLGWCPGTALKEFDDSGGAKNKDNGASVLTDPKKYQEYLDLNDVFRVFEEAMRNLATSQPPDPYEKVLEFLKEQAKNTNANLPTG